MSEADPNDAACFAGVVVAGPIYNLDAPAEIGILTVKAVHYPDCQQLIVWLPQSGYHGYGDVSVAGPAGVIDAGDVRSRLNGSVQILWDTLAWTPGVYRIEIGHGDGWRHVAELEKHTADAPPPAPEAAAPVPELDAGRRVYRDGFGQIIPDVDLELRKAALEDLTRKFTRHLEYEGNFRGGVIVYVDGARRIRFSHEMAGAPYKFFIDVPSAAQWESATGAKLSERDEILLFVATQVQREQASSWTFEIRETEIVFR